MNGAALLHVTSAALALQRCETLLDRTGRACSIPTAPLGISPFRVLPTSSGSPCGVAFPSFPSPTRFHEATGMQGFSQFVGARSQGSLPTAAQPLPLSWASSRIFRFESPVAQGFVALRSVRRLAPPVAWRCMRLPDFAHRFCAHPPGLDGGDLGPDFAGLSPLALAATARALAGASGFRSVTVAAAFRFG